ncbi:MAG: ABC transporter substrate-binding protein [Spirochaetales bacterium]|nr:ABC transporter substrate-binding protein [Spirochaetales bacterium]
MNFGHRRKFFITILFFSFLFSSFILPIQAESNVRGSFIITDMRGRSVSVPGEVKNIIALGAGSLRLIGYFNAVDKIVAVEDQGHGREKTAHDYFSLATYRLAFPELRELPSIGSAENHEGIIAAAPDLIISSTVDRAQLDQLQTVLGIPVFAINADVELHDTQAFYRQLTALGKVLDLEERADELIEGISGILSDLAARAALVQNPKRAYAGGMMFYGPADLLRTTGDYLPFDLTGTKNVMPTSPAKNRQPYMTSLEDLIAAKPDYIFIDAANINLSKSGFITNRIILEELVPAFQNQRVFTSLVYKYYGTNWENQLINVYYTGSVLYPELFRDISLEKKAEEIWNLFFNVVLDYNTVTLLQRAVPGRVDWFN